MADYQNIFTQVQVRGRADPGVPLDRGDHGARSGSPASPTGSGGSATRRSGRSISAGPGIASLICGFIAIEIIGLNMWASVDWDPVAVRPPAALAGARAAAARTTA